MSQIQHITKELIIFNVSIAVDNLQLNSLSMCPWLAGPRTRTGFIVLHCAQNAKLKVIGILILYCLDAAYHKMTDQ